MTNTDQESSASVVAEFPVVHGERRDVPELAWDHVRSMSCASLVGSKSFFESDRGQEVATAALVAYEHLRTSHLLGADAPEIDMYGNNPSNGTQLARRAREAAERSSVRFKTNGQEIFAITDDAKVPVNHLLGEPIMIALVEAICKDLMRSEHNRQLSRFVCLKEGDAKWHELRGRLHNKPSGDPETGCKPDAVGTAQPAVTAAAAGAGC